MKYENAMVVSNVIMYCAKCDGGWDATVSIDLSFDRLIEVEKTCPYCMAKAVTTHSVINGEVYVGDRFQNQEGEKV